MRKQKNYIICSSYKMHTHTYTHTRALTSGIRVINGLLKNVRVLFVYALWYFFVLGRGLSSHV